MNSYVDNPARSIACRQVATFFVTTDNSKTRLRMAIDPKLKLLTVEEVAEIFRRDRTTIDRWCRERPGFPKKIRMDAVGSRFLAAEIEDYIRQCIANR